MLTRRQLIVNAAAVVAGAAVASSAEVARRGPPERCPAPGPPRNSPPQPAAFVFDGDGGPDAARYAVPGGLVCVGRDNYGDGFARALAAGGATVLVYLDAIIDNAHGRYHELLLADSVLGPAAGMWPGEPRANGYGRLTDFRPGSVVQQKLAPVLDLIARENPHIGGLFLDDVGTRSWFPGFDFDAWLAADKAAYRDGAVQLVRTARSVADRHDLALFVNGTWTAGDGGGYPDPALSGCSLVDGGVIENHGVDEIPFFAGYAASPQWGADTPRGIGYAWTINDGDDATREAYVRAGVPAFACSQPDRDTPEAPWGPIHDAGLPRGACAAGEGGAQ